MSHDTQSGLPAGRESHNEEILMKSLLDGSFRQQILTDVSPIVPFVLPLSLSAYLRFIRAKNGNYVYEAEGWDE